MMNGGNKFKLWVEIWNEPFFKCKYLQNEGGKKNSSAPNHRTLKWDCGMFDL